MAGFFNIFGIFVLWGFIAWLTVLVALLVADAAWTHGLATSYLHGTSMVLQQIWSFLGIFFQFVQRVMAMAPRGLQLLVFFILGTFMFGILVNWFFAANVVCSDGTAYESDFGSAWFAKTMVNDPIKNSSVNSSGSGVVVLTNSQPASYVANNSGSYSSGVQNIFSSASITRRQFITRSIASDNASFVPLKGSSEEFVTYSCDKDDVQVGLFGIKDLLSFETFVVVAVIAGILWALKFFGLF